MSFEGYHSANAALSSGILAVNGSGNKVYMTWASTTALNIGSGNLIQYRFRADAGVSTTLTWDTQTAGACEYSDINGNVITTFYNTSTISTVANALIVNAGTDIIQTGASVQLNGSVTGGTAPYSYLWAPAATLSNSAILNPIASPTATTSYTLTVNSVGCSGSDVMTVIFEVVPINLSLQNINLPSGTNICYDATNTITVAGSGTTFVVQSGGSAEMIAGQKISYLPGTRVFSGGYMHGHITTSGQYCSPTAPQMEVTSTGVNDLATASGELFRVYPNPTSGNFTVELTDLKSSGNAVITVFGSMGETIQNAEMNGISKQALSLSEKPAGIYFIRVVAGDKQSTRKIIRK
jgi:hypothetical protein